MRIRFDGCGFAYGYYFGVVQWLKCTGLVTDKTEIVACSGGCFAALAMRSKNNILEIGKRHASEYQKLSLHKKILSMKAKRHFIERAFDDLTAGGINMSGISIYTSNLNTVTSELHSNFKNLGHLKKVVVASCSIPFFTSMGTKLDNHYHVDGGLFAPRHTTNDYTKVSYFGKGHISPDTVPKVRTFALGYRNSYDFNLDVFRGTVDAREFCKQLYIY